MSNARIHLLPELGVIAFNGRDARTFLQSQLTADLAGLTGATAQPAAWCTPQGRVTALLWLFPTTEGVLAVLPREQSQAVVEGLRRFVMRAQVKVEDLTGAWQVAGLSGLEEPSREGIPGTSGDLFEARMTASRRLLAGSPAAMAVCTEASVAASSEEWWAGCIREGEARVDAATSGAWIPQMLNLDRIGAVSFSKGCYPGQEIIARTHHLGRSKRRMARFHASGEPLPAPADPVFDGTTKVGEVVYAAAVEPAELLAVVNLEAFGRKLTDASGTVALTPRPLPYTIEAS